MKDKTTALITFGYDFGGVKRLGIDVTALINQMQDIENSFEECNMDINYESMWKSLKEILKSELEKK